MTERQFICWLRGYICDLEIKTLSETQVEAIKKQLGRIDHFPDNSLTQKP